MSCSSSERRPADRAAGSSIIIFLALLLAGLSATMPGFADRAERRTVPIATATAPAQPQAHRSLARGEHRPVELLAPVDQGADARSYHPSFETSDSAGTLGFWILISLCAALLTAGFAPWLVQWLRGRE